MDSQLKNHSLLKQPSLLKDSKHSGIIIIEFLAFLLAI